MALRDIETIVVVMLENRSFDHMLGYLSLPDANPPMPVDGLRVDPGWISAHANRNPQPNRPPIPPAPLNPNIQVIDDPPHDADSIDTQINTPPHSGPPAKMGGFVESYAKSDPSDQALVMGYYKADGVRTFDFFARNFAVCDNWYSPLPTGTQPNRLMAMSGTSSIKDNATFDLPTQSLVYDWLNTHQIPWCSYQWAGFPFFTLMLDWAPEIIGSLNDPFNLGPFRRYEGFHEQWNSGQTPRVIFIEPKYTDDKISWSAPNDDHPPTGAIRGQDFLKEIYRTLTSNSDRWANTMMIVTYDEHGGFFDHADPLSIAANAGGFQFRSTGPRVPAFVVSPHVGQGVVFHNKVDHTSILRLLAERFTPGQPYSAEVAARQQHLEPLDTVLMPSPPAQPRIPAMPPAIRALTHVLAATAPTSAVGATAPKETETAVAFDHMAHEMARSHPELLTGPLGIAIANYVGQVPAPGATTLMPAKPRLAPTAKRKSRRKSKPKSKVKRSVKSKPSRRPKRRTRR